MLLRVCCLQYMICALSTIKVLVYVVRVPNFLMTVPNAEWDSSERESNNLCLDDESFFRFVKQRVNTKNEAQTNLRCFEKLLWILHVPLYEKRHHSTKTGHLFLCQLKLWIWLKSWRWNKIKMSNRGDSYFTVKYVERTQRRGFESSIGATLKPLRAGRAKKGKQSWGTCSMCFSTFR